MPPPQPESKYAIFLQLRIYKSSLAATEFRDIAFICRFVSAIDLEFFGTARLKGNFVRLASGNPQLLWGHWQFLAPSLFLVPLHPIYGWIDLEEQPIGFGLDDVQDNLISQNSDGSLICPVCESAFKDLSSLSVHLVEMAEASDGAHVMWLNRNLTKHRTSTVELERLLAAAMDGGGISSDKVKR